MELGDHDGLEVVAAHASPARLGRDRVRAREHRHSERLELAGHRREDPPGVDLVRERGEVLEIQAERIHPVGRRAEDPVGIVRGDEGERADRPGFGAHAAHHRAANAYFTVRTAVMPCTKWFVTVPSAFLSSILQNIT